MKISRISREFAYSFRPMICEPPLKKRCRLDSRNSNDNMFLPESILHFIAKQVSTNEERIQSRTLVKLSTILLCEYLKALKNNDVQSNFEKHSKERVMLSCKCCMELLYNPITLLCGHSFCKTCVNYNPGSSSTTCITCNMTFSEKNETFRPNVILSSAISKCCPLEISGRKLTIEGLTLFKDKRYEAAIEKFTQALEILPNSHHVIFHRAKAHYHLENYQEALIDTIRSTYLIPKWPEAHYLKGEIWYKLHFYEDALFSLLISYSLQCSNNKIKKRIKQLIKIVSDPNLNKASCMSSSSLTQLKASIRKLPHHFSQKSLNMFTEDCLASLPFTEAFAELKSVHLNEEGSFSHCGDFNEIERLSCVTYTTTTSLPLLKSQCVNSNSFGFSKRKQWVPTADMFSTNNPFDNPICIDGLQNLCSSIVQNESNSQSDFGSESFKDNFLLNLLDPTDFTCSLCMSVFYNPICTPCGHVYCHSCIEQSFDHIPFCPNCKRSLRGFISELVKSTQTGQDIITEHLLKTYLPTDYAERKLQYQQDIDQLSELQPIFVCTIAFPSMPCPLHVFEPRYRLMLRRCFSHNDREFGMCMPAENKPHSTVGTLLKVRDVTFFDDGRSIVDCIGFRRFRTSKRETRDGYNVAALAFIVDEKVTEETAVNDLIQLLNKTYDAASLWYNNLPSPIKSTIMQNYGPFPEKDNNNVNTENGPNWIWWILAVIPVSNSIKLQLLGNAVLKDRLRVLNRIFTCLRTRQINS